MTGPPATSLVTESVAGSGMITVVIRGELDVVTAPLLSRQLAPALDDGPQRLVFDMAGVDFIDCAAVRLIVSTGQYLPTGRLPVIRRPSVAVRRVLELTGLAAACEVDPGGEPPR